jgi:hypothetical protein
MRRSQDSDMRPAQKPFAIRTTNEINFARGDTRGRPSRMQACAAKTAICEMVVSHYLRIMATMLHYGLVGMSIRRKPGPSRYPRPASPPRARSRLDRHSALAMSFKESHSRSQDTDMRPIQARPGRKQDRPAKAALAIGSVTLPAMLGTI